MHNLLRPGLFAVLTTGLVAFFTLVYAEDNEDQKKVNAAIEKGVNFLLKKGLKGREAELEALTLLHCGIDPKKNGDLSNAISQMLNSNLKENYRVALTAMALEMADRVKYQRRIAECAHALVNWQCKNGQWDYDAKYDISFGQPVFTNEPAEQKEAITAIVSGEENRPAPTKKGELKKIKIKRTNPKRMDKGDNSNTQFALLGLRAAARAGCEIPKETWDDAASFLEKDCLGGWTYTGKMAPNDPRNPYGSMTCACVCGLAIAKFYLGEEPASNNYIKKGLEWLGTNMTFNNNPGADRSFLGNADFWHYYYIYGVERVGAVLDMKEIGNHNWYEEGKQYLLGAQNDKDGSWNTAIDDSFSPPVADTCFALLFLKKATPSLIKAKVTGESEPNK